MFGLPADVPWPNRRLYNRGAGWRAINPSIPFSQMLPLQDCLFYDQVLKEGCPHDVVGYLETMYGPGVMRGPNFFKDGADIAKQAVFLATKQHEIIIFFWCVLFWVCLVCAVAKCFSKGRFRRSHYRHSGVLIVVALGLRLTFAIGRMVYCLDTSGILLVLIMGLLWQS